MLRITVHNTPQIVTFQLEGMLAGPWVQELEACCQSSLVHPSRPVLRVDLTGVTFIDEAGKSLLARLHREGTDFIAADCLMKAIVSEITFLESLPDDACKDGGGQ